MKKIKLLALSSLVVITSLTAMSAKVKKPIETVEGTSVGQYAKPGAPVDIQYKTTHIDVGEVSNIDITFITREVAQKEMKIKIAVDKNLNVVSGKSSYIFQPKEGKNENSIKLKLSGFSDGEYFIRIFVDMGNKGMRAFTVPVRVGDFRKTMQKTKHFQKGTSGENITVSQGVETIH